MKKLISLLLAALLCLCLASCEGMIPGVGNGTGEGGYGRDTENDSFGFDSFPPPDGTEEATEVSAVVHVDWRDFVRVNGVAYDGGFSNTTIPASQVGELIGEIEHNVRIYYESEAEYNADRVRDMSSYTRAVGCKVYKVKDEYYSIAVKDGEKYYIYTAITPVQGEITISPDSVRGYSDYSCLKAGITEVSVNSSADLAKVLYDPARVDPKLAEFTDDYFLRHTLVIVELESGWGGREFGIRSIAKSGDDLSVQAVQLDSSGGGDEAMHTWTFFISIPKTDDKKVFVDLSGCEPGGKTEIVPYEEYEKTVGYLTKIDPAALGEYSGTALLDKYHAQAVIQEKYSNIYGLKIRYEQVNNYWLAEFYTQNGCKVQMYAVVIRAADGKIVNGN